MGRINPRCFWVHSLRKRSKLQEINPRPMSIRNSIRITRKPSKLTHIELPNAGEIKDGAYGLQKGTIIIRHDAIYSAANVSTANDRRIPTHPDSSAVFKSRAANNFASFGKLSMVVHVRANARMAAFVALYTLRQQAFATNHRGIEYDRR